MLGHRCNTYGCSYKDAGMIRSHTTMVHGTDMECLYRPESIAAAMNGVGHHEQSHDDINLISSLPHQSHYSVFHGTEHIYLAETKVKLLICSLTEECGLCVKYVWSTRVSYTQTVL